MPLEKHQIQNWLKMLLAEGMTLYCLLPLIGMFRTRKTNLLCSVVLTAISSSCTSVLFYTYAWCLEHQDIELSKTNTDLEWGDQALWVVAIIYLASVFKKKVFREHLLFRIEFAGFEMQLITTGISDPVKVVWRTVLVVHSAWNLNEFSVPFELFALYSVYFHALQMSWFSEAPFASWIWKHGAVHCKMFHWTRWSVCTIGPSPFVVGSNNWK